MKKLFVIIGIVILLLILFLTITIYCTKDESVKFSDGTISMTLSPKDVIFKAELQNPDVKLQDHEILISKKYVDELCSDLSDENNNDIGGLLLGKRYTFYENTKFGRIEFGNFQIFKRYSMKDIRNLMGNNSNDVTYMRFDVGLKEEDHFSILAKKGDGKNVYLKRHSARLEMVDSKLTSRYSCLSYDISIIIGTYKTENKYSERSRLSSPYYKTKNILLKKTDNGIRIETENE
ncbi:MAG: hypothetical protein LBC74_07035 [Planctomycetaceae bacterium]|jgi:hypothetical protein|nr:hypothetical protein [Planctomycetaceae bacterium]